MRRRTGLCISGAAVALASIAMWWVVFVWNREDDLSNIIAARGSPSCFITSLSVGRNEHGAREWTFRGVRLHHRDMKELCESLAQPAYVAVWCDDSIIASGFREFVTRDVPQQRAFRYYGALGGTKLVVYRVTMNGRAIRQPDVHLVHMMWYWAP